jgi:hypothetical protein
MFHLALGLRVLFFKDRKGYLEGFFSPLDYHRTKHRLAQAPDLISVS